MFIIYFARTCVVRALVEHTLVYLCVTVCFLTQSWDNYKIYSRWGLQIFLTNQSMCCIYKALKKIWTLSIIISQESVKASTVVFQKIVGGTWNTSWILGMERDELLCGVRVRLALNRDLPVGMCSWVSSPVKPAEQNLLLVAQASCGFTLAGGSEMRPALSALAGVTVLCSVPGASLCKHLLNCGKVKSCYKATAHGETCFFFPCGSRGMFRVCTVHDSCGCASHPITNLLPLSPESLFITFL